MEVHVRDDKQIVEIWLTNAEKQDGDLRKRLEDFCQPYREKKYLVAVFKSGSQDLGEETSALLCYNRRRSAEQEVQKKRVRTSRGAIIR